MLWVPDRGIATTIAKAVQCDLAPHAKTGGWFDVEPETATAALEIASVRIYAGEAMAWHDQLMAQWTNGGRT
ncbi:hypothetical protein JQ633_32050 [Bradyrhizobium tropiciagri]|uniref:hypothetical protein n=1 Tax=Bradyrhizobium tropiciagri TaxID=312253 RepID=UPI001BACB080|nr:hypothetical protein [Bradyrhizobium tropiciagri]MBR0875030.1 hypothetical protein [Bradyrhizobium tropiciagri]